MLPDFTELLTLAGFTLRGKRRATCAWCAGHDHITASYTSTYVHCFRCGATKGYIALARELGILSKNLSETDRAKIKEIRVKEKRRIDFLAWQHSKLKIIVEKITILTGRARLAHDVLRVFPEQENAWQALADFYNQEAQLFAAFDFFAMANVSQWLEQESVPKELVALFNEQAGRSR